MVKDRENPNIKSENFESKPHKEKPEDIRDKRLSEIDSELTSSAIVEEPSEEKDFQKKVSEIEAGLGVSISQETKGEIHEKLVEEPLNNAQKYIERHDALQLEKERLEKMKKIQQILSPEDYQSFIEIIGNDQGNLDKIFDPTNKFLHTTSNDVFDKMLVSGVILTHGETQKTPGASFVDGNFPEAISFQLIYDNMAGGGKEKKLNSENYSGNLGGTLSDNFIKYFWDNHPQDAKYYLAQLAKQIPAEELSKMGINLDKELISFEDATKIATFFKPLSREGFGVTIVYDSGKKDNLGIGDHKTSGLQKFFEKRSLMEGGVPINEASVILVPKSQVELIKDKLKQRGITSVEVRASEELDARRIYNKI